MKPRNRGYFYAVSAGLQYWHSKFSRTIHACPTTEILTAGAGTGDDGPEEDECPCVRRPLHILEPPSHYVK